MKYSMTLKDAMESGIVVTGEKPTVESVEIFWEGNEAKYRYITTSVACSPDALEKWRISREMRCERCNYRWTSILTSGGRPRSCPVCKSPYWDRPRRSRPTEKITPILRERDGKIYRSEYVCRICDIAWAKDVDVLNVECPRCRRKCGATSRQVEISAEVAQGLEIVEEVEPISFEEFVRQEEKKDAVS